MRLIFIFQRRGQEPPDLGKVAAGEPVGGGSPHGFMPVMEGEVHESFCAFRRIEEPQRPRRLQAYLIEGITRG